MPKVLYDTEAQWLDVYRCRIRDISHPLNGQTVGYGRVWAGRCEGPYDDSLTRFDRRVTKLTSLFSIQTADRILVGGCGLGFLVEAFLSAGFSNCWGIDNSPHVDAIKAVEADGNVIIINQPLKGSGQLNAKLIQETGANNFKWVITESIVESYDDGSEMDDILDACEVGLTNGEPLDQIIHMVMSVKDVSKPDRSIGSQFNQKTLAEWKAVRPTHSWVDYVTWEVG